MWACSWEINLEPLCQKKNFPVISRGSSCYKYVQERSPRVFFASSHVKIKGHAFPTSDVPWSCDRILSGIMEQEDVLFCDVFLWILFTLICLQWQRYVNSIHFRFLHKFFIYRLELLLVHVFIHELMGILCHAIQLRSNFAVGSQLLIPVFSGVTSGFYV